jgi:hypothetical protein
VKLRLVIMALQQAGYASRVKPPPDNLPGHLRTRQLSMPCINPDCSERATVNYSITSDHGNDGMYDCSSCGLTGDAMSLILSLAGDDLDPYGEMTTRDRASMAHVWARQHGIETAENAPPTAPESQADDDETGADAPPYTPSWLED